MTRPAPWKPPSPQPARFEGLGLVLRPYVPADGPALFAAIDSSRDTLLPWMPWAATQHRSVADSLASIEAFARARADLLDPEHNAIFGFVVGVFDGAELVAGTGFNRVDPGAHNAEIGYWVRADRRRRGIATRAAAVMLSWIFTAQRDSGFGFRRAHIFAARANVASCGVPDKLGLRRASHTRADRWVDGLGFTDTVSWDVLATEWDPIRHALRNTQGQIGYTGHPRSV